MTIFGVPPCEVCGAPSVVSWGSFGPDFDESHDACDLHAPEWYCGR